MRASQAVRVADMADERRGYRRRTGVIKTAPWQKLGTYYPDTVNDGGRDAPMTRRSRMIYVTAGVFVVGIGTLLILVSR
jgi:hypothetical protein